VDVGKAHSVTGDGMLASKPAQVHCSAVDTVAKKSTESLFLLNKGR